MKEFKGTKGPWQLTSTPTGKQKVTDSNGFSICTSPFATSADRYNAHLIAAAPELLETAQFALKHIYDNSLENQLPRSTRQLQAAINKALGI